MRYESVAEAYRDLEAASAGLELIDRLAELFRETPIELLPTLLDGRRPTDLLEVVSHLTWHLTLHRSQVGSPLGGLLALARSV